MAKSPASRPAQDIIDDALADNRWWEWLCFVVVIVVVATGVTVLAVGIINEKEVVAVTGGGVTGLFWPALRFARGFRQDNIRIRLHELPLAMAKTPEEAARFIREAIGALKQPANTPAGGSP